MSVFDIRRYDVDRRGRRYLARMAPLAFPAANNKTKTNEVELNRNPGFATATNFSFSRSTKNLVICSWSAFR